ncbi:potassium channel family protein [Candidatus Poriferisodalis sp.]|uniref:potassium channel family protein n=1 Tax=Candidatus Poriferisodalis sp. TaxID=3101277 RepID=UPI003B58D13A
MSVEQTSPVESAASAQDRKHDAWIRWTDPWLVSAAVASVPLFLMESRVGPSALTAVQIANWAIWGFFAADLGVRLVLTEMAPARYLRRYWFDVAIVVLALIPVVRPLRVLRSARVLRLLRLTTGMSFLAALWHGRGRRAWRSLRGGNALIVVFVVVVVAPILVWLVERAGGGQIDTLGESLWWGAATITTVGYGDVAPVTWLGRSIAVVLMLAGITGFGVVTANMAARFTRTDSLPSAPVALAQLAQFEAAVLSQGLSQSQHVQARQAVETLHRLIGSSEDSR